MIELETRRSSPSRKAGTYAKYEAGPLQAGYGVTLGKRSGASSCRPSRARRSRRSRSATSTRSSRRSPGVKEDVTQIVLNVKKLRLKSFASHPVQLRLIKSGAGR